MLPPASGACAPSKTDAGPHGRGGEANLNAACCVAAFVSNIYSGWKEARAMETGVSQESTPARQTLKGWLYSQLEPAARTRRGLSAANQVICTLIVLSAIFAIMETEPSLVGPHLATFLAVEIGITIVFAAEYLLRVWVSSQNPAYGGGLRGYVRYVLSPVAICDLLALAPIVLALGGSPAFLLRAFRLLRILRLARLGRFSRATRYLGVALSARRHELVLSVAIAALLILAASTLLYAAEGSLQPEAFGSIPRAMWWAVSTLTTVGYGDVYPITPLGKILAGVSALAAIGLIALPAGILAAAFSDAGQREKQDLEEARRGEGRPD
jgi:voltage-gated potassium channel